MATEIERVVLAQYSTPGLRKTELSRGAKKDQLGSLGIKGKRADDILDELYGPEQKPEVGEHRG
jgi:hypothetical protein